jgi:S-adenosylmethionine-dependent methyltransferase
MDRNFDDIATRFQKNIYGSPKGKIRLAILWRDLCEQIPHIQAESPLRILDAGAGMGQMALRLARLGHVLTVCDISEKMLEQARELIGKKEPGAQVSYVHGPVQEVLDRQKAYYDVVLFHAVLEWVASPRETLSKLLQSVKPGGYLSLMFYNYNSVVLRNVLRGNFRKVKSQQFQGDPGSLTPTTPLDPVEVYQWLEDDGIDIQLKSGVRVFYDYLSKEMRESRSLEDILEMEQMYSRTEPYMSMGRYIHVIGQKR